MAVLSSKLIISLVDRVSGPARAIQSSLAGLMGVTRGKSGALAFGPALAAQLGRIRQATTTLTGTVAMPLALIGRSGFEAAYGLERALNNMQAVGMLTDKQRDSLAEYIQLLNNDFPFTNKEIAEAAFEMFRAGFNFDQVKAALKDTLTLAMAGDISRQQAADIATNVLTAMRLPMKTQEQAAASMKRVADTIAYAANKSNTDVRLMGETFKYVAPLAAAAGMSLEEVAAAAMIMANNGIKGSEAGVAMRAALVRMAKPTKEMMATLGRLGINLGDFVKGGRKITADDIVTGLMASGINAGGAKKRIEALLKDQILSLKPAQLIATMTDELASTLGDSSIIGKDKLAAALTDIITASGKKIDLLGFMRALREKKVGVAEIARIMDVRQGSRVLTLTLDDIEQKAREVVQLSKDAAQRMADTRMKGIVGSVARLKAAWENLFVSIGKAGVMDSLSAAFQRLADGLTSVGKANPQLLKFGAYAAMTLFVLGPLGMLIQGVGAAFTVLAASARIAGIATLFLGRSLLFTAPAAAIAGLAGTFAAIGRAARSAAVGIAIMNMATGAGVASRFTFLGLAAAGAASKIGALVMTFGRFLLIGTGIGLIVGAIAAAGTFIYNNWQGLGQFFVGFGEGFMKALGPAKPIVEGIAAAFGKIFDWLGKLLGPLDESGAKWRAWGETVGGVVGGVVKRVIEGVKWLGRLIDLISFGFAGKAGRWLGRQLGLTDDEVKKAAAKPAAPGVIPQSKAPADKAIVKAPSTRPSVPSVPGGPLRAEDLAELQSKARAVEGTVRTSMTQVQAIVGAVDLTSDGRRIIESLAAGMRQGIPAVTRAAQEAAGKAAKAAIRGSYTDGGFN